MMYDMDSLLTPSMWKGVTTHQITHDALLPPPNGSKWWAFGPLGHLSLVFLAIQVLVYVCDARVAKNFKPGFWLADSTAASQSEAMLENPCQLTWISTCILCVIILIIQSSTRSRHFLSQKFWYFHKNIHTFVSRKECCCLCKVDISNVNVT